MKLRLHHLEMCVSNPSGVVGLLQKQFGLELVGHRETKLCEQYVLQMNRTVFVVTGRKCMDLEKNNNVIFGPLDEDWTVFCCDADGLHQVDSVFNIALEVRNLDDCLAGIERTQSQILRPISHVSDGIRYAVVKSCCGNVVHTLIEKPTNSKIWFLPGFTRLQEPIANGEQMHNERNLKIGSVSYFDHVALACRVGETNSIIEWYEKAFGMKRFLTNRQDTEEEGLIIGNDVGMRLKVLQFWKCSENGLASSSEVESDQGNEWETLKIVVVESLPDIPNTQIENFVRDHKGPGLQHVGLHTSNIVSTVKELCRNGVRLRQPPPTYYTEIGQLHVIKSVGEDVDLLKKYGILLDNEADVFDQEKSDDRYLMQVFTHPIFDRDTFFLEVIQRRGAHGFGVGNVTALARSVNAYQLQQKMLKDKKMNDQVL